MQASKRGRQPFATRIAVCEAGQKIYGSCRPGNALEVRGARLQAVGCGVRRRLQLRHIQRCQQSVAAIEHPHMRPVELVGTAGQQIAAPVLHIHQCMRCIGHGIHEAECAHCFGQGHGTLHIVDRAQRIGCCTYGYHLRPRGHLPLEIIPVQFAGCRVQPHRTQQEPAVLGDGLPRPAIGVMVQVRHHNLVAGLQTTPDGPCQVERERGHVGAEDYFVWRAVQEVRKRTACSKNDGVRLHAGGESPMRIGVVV